MTGAGRGSGVATGTRLADGLTRKRQRLLLFFIERGGIGEPRRAAAPQAPLPLAEIEALRPDHDPAGRGDEPRQAKAPGHRERLAGQAERPADQMRDHQPDRAAPSGGQREHRGIRHDRERGRDQRDAERPARQHPRPAPGGLVAPQPHRDDRADRQQQRDRGAEQRQRDVGEPRARQSEQVSDAVAGSGVERGIACMIARQRDRQRQRANEQRDRRDQRAAAHRARLRRFPPQARLRTARHRPIPRISLEMRRIHPLPRLRRQANRGASIVGSIASRA